jgi:hypothetical protein
MHYVGQGGRMNEIDELEKFGIKWSVCIFLYYHGRYAKTTENVR